jgi:uncharacterized membrane protein required for colicin V production
MTGVDLFVLFVLAGCAILGLAWGALRMATAGAAVAAAVLAGRWAGPAAARLFTGNLEPSSHERMAAVVVVAIVAAVLVWLAGMGLRRGVAALHLGFLDRAAGMALGAAAAVVLLAVLLGLAALGGHPPSSPWASRLSQAGTTWLALQKLSAKSAIPSSTPRIPTSKGQQPH